MTITISIWWVVLGGFIGGVALAVSYFLGQLNQVENGHEYDFELINKALSSLNADRNAWQDERADLEVMACVSSGKCRRTPKQYIEELRDRILDREAERMSEECKDKDCESCDPKDCVCGEGEEANKADRDAVIATNIEAAESAHNESHIKALERCASVRKAAQASIGIMGE